MRCNVVFTRRNHTAAQALAVTIGGTTIADAAPVDAEADPADPEGRVLFDGTHFSVDALRFMQGLGGSIVDADTGELIDFDAAP